MDDQIENYNANDEKEKNIIKTQLTIINRDIQVPSIRILSHR